MSAQPAVHRCQPCTLHWLGARRSNSELTGGTQVLSQPAGHRRLACTEHCSSSELMGGAQAPAGSACRTIPAAAAEGRAVVAAGGRLVGGHEVQVLDQPAGTGTHLDEGSSNAGGEGVQVLRLWVTWAAAGGIGGMIADTAARSHRQTAAAGAAAGPEPAGPDC